MVLTEIQNVHYANLLYTYEYITIYIFDVKHTYNDVTQKDKQNK
jgi:hypothetical protein